MPIKGSGRVMTVDEDGQFKCYKRLSGPLRAGGVIIKIEVLQAGDKLDEDQAELLEQEFKVFLASLKRGRAISLPDDLLAARLLEQTADQAFNRLLSVRDVYAHWMLLAWTSEAKYLLGRLSPDHPRYADVLSAAKRIKGWNRVLQFEESEQGSNAEVDWLYMSNYARRQADRTPRVEVECTSPKSLRLSGQAQPLFPNLRRMKEDGHRLFLVGGKEDMELVESCQQVVGPVVEWLACIPNDSYQSTVRMRLKHGGAGGVVVLPGVDQALAQDLANFTSDLGAVCAIAASADGPGILDALWRLEAAKQKA